MTRLCSRHSKTRNKDEITTSHVSFLSQTHLSGNLEIPPFSSLNADVIPKAALLDAVDKHQPKIDTELIKEIWRTIGLQSSDERVYKLASAMMEVQMLKIISELRAVAP
jgi:hypothetical protein